MSIPTPYLSQYLPEDREFVYHKGDDSLDEIHVPLPSLEEWYSKQLKRPVSRDEALTYVDGFGLPAKDQKFKHQILPEKLKNIYEVVFAKLRVLKKAEYKEISDVDAQDIFDELDNNREHYKEEIKWIKLQIKRRYVGYWFFCKGKPTYLNGANYFFINFWKVKNRGRNDNLPDYRDYQRGIFHLLHYAHTTTTAYYRHRLYWREDGQIREKFFNDWKALCELRDEKTAVGISCGWQKDVGFAIDVGKRTVNGVNFISGRRIAKTASACCYCFWGATNVPEQSFFIQAMNDDQAKEKIFVGQIQIPFDTLPFFFKPFVRGREESKSGFKFMYEGQMATMYKAGVVPPPLNSIVKPLSSNEKAADGEEINYMYRDEPAKKTDEGAKDQNIPTWWFNTAKPATERGDEIIGFCIMPSTVGKMDTGGGSQFLEIVQSSHFADRDDNGCTPSGLINFLLPGYYAIPNFIDEYGDTVIEDPVEPVMSNEGKWIRIGAKTWLENKISYFQKNKMWDELTQLLQNYPPDFKAAFSMSVKDMGYFPIEAMKDQVSDLRFDPKKKNLVGNIDFEWEEDQRRVRTNIHGKGLWTYTWLPPKAMWNKTTTVSVEDGYYAPKGGGPIYAPDYSVSDKIFIAFDPVVLHKRNKRGKKSSTPAAAIFLKRDYEIDPQDKPREEWVSNDFIGYIATKTDDKEVIYEEILKAAILLGAYIYPESNAGEHFIEWVRDKGYDGYLLRDMDIKGRIEEQVGVWADPGKIQNMFQMMATFFTQNVKYMKIWQIIDDWLQMTGADDLTDHDLAAASGWCLRAANQRTGDFLKQQYEPMIVIMDIPSFAV